MISKYQAKYFAYELSKQSQSDNPEKFGATLLDARVELNPHQVEAALFAFKSPYSKGAILADEVGLGKTIEAGILLSQKWAEGQRRILIICPSSLRKQWLNEMADKFYLPCEVIESRSFRQHLRSGRKNPFDDPSSIKITSFQYARNQAEPITLNSWDLVVIDEAHYLRNVYKPNQLTAREVRKAVAPFKKVLLTATPLQNRLEELYGLVSIIDSNIFGDLKTFRKDYVKDSLKGQLDELKDRLRDVCHRTLRRDVREFINFKGRIPFTQTFQPSPQEQQLYDLVLEYLHRDDLYALPFAQRHLIESVIFKLLGSSSFAIARTLEGLLLRLRSMLASDEVSYDEDYLTQIASDLDSYSIEDSDVADIETETRFLSDEDKSKIEAEIFQLESLLSLAEKIESNAKGENLLIALEKGFEELKRLGAKDKALIFTESTRTQKYLFQILSHAGYTDRIVLFNGSNADPLSSRIYESWKNEEANRHKVTGSKSVDIRNALVDAFKSDHYQIMIGTEAAAEGLNLQFCSMVVNYDLPWNPQRVEQRIGRCHRYGQEHDVVVINFLNAGNATERRIFELLDKKFQLFEGVFGASDDVLGAIESGVDFEKRILSIYKLCRTRDEINAAFDALQEELKSQIQSVMKDTQAKLFEHFDAQVIDKLRTTLVETRTFISLLEQWLWAITRFYLADRAVFYPDDFTFTLQEAIPDIAEKDTYSLNKKRTDAIHYRVQGDLAQTLIGWAKNENTPDAKLTFSYNPSARRHAGIDQLPVKSGYMKLVNLHVHSEIEDQDVIIFGAADEKGHLLTDELCQYLLRLPCSVEPVVISDQKAVNKIYQRQKEKHLSLLESNDARLLQREVMKFTHWAEDKIEASEIEYKEIKKKIKELNREADREGISADELLYIQEKVSRLERKRKKLRIEMFDLEDDIIAQREQMIHDARLKINRTFTETELFTIAWEIQ